MASRNYNIDNLIDMTGLDSQVIEAQLCQLRFDIAVRADTINRETDKQFLERQLKINAYYIRCLDVNEYLRYRDTLLRMLYEHQEQLNEAIWHEDLRQNIKLKVNK